MSEVEEEEPAAAAQAVTLELHFDYKHVDVIVMTASVPSDSHTAQGAM